METAITISIEELNQAEVSTDRAEIEAIIEQGRPIIRARFAESYTEEITLFTNDVDNTPAYFVAERNSEAGEYHLYRWTTPDAEARARSHFENIAGSLTEYFEELASLDDVEGGDRVAEYRRLRDTGQARIEY